MSTDSTFQDKMQSQDQTQGTVPSETETDEPLMSHDDPDKYDPLTTPDLDSDDHPQGWDDPQGRDMPEADEQSPLSDDRR